MQRVKRIKREKSTPLIFLNGELVDIEDEESINSPEGLESEGNKSDNENENNNYDQNDEGNAKGINDNDETDNLPNDEVVFTEAELQAVK